MGLLRDYATGLHKQTKRDYIGRMVNNKPECMKVAKRYDLDYWDGDRCYGYGGHHYIPGRWRPIAERLMKDYSLKSDSKILDLGCGKGFLLHEIKILCPEITVVGIDNSLYGIKNSKEEIRPYIIHHNAEVDPLNFADKSFDLVISLATLHNFRLSRLRRTLSEIARVGKQGFVMVESFRNDLELFNLQCWALTAQTFLEPEDWIWFFEESGYFGDYEFIFFE